MLFYILLFSPLFIFCLFLASIFTKIGKKHFDYLFGPISVLLVLITCFPVLSWVRHSHDLAAISSRVDIDSAKRSIEQRRLGPMSGVISFVGDYK